MQPGIEPEDIRKNDLVIMLPNRLKIRAIIYHIF